MRAIARFLTRLLSNWGTMFCMVLNILCGLVTLGYYVPLTEIHWLSWKPLVRLRFKYRV